MDRVKEIICVECHTNTMSYVDFGDIHESFLALECRECKGIFISFELFEKAIMHYGLRRKNIPKKIDAPDEKKRDRDNLYPCPICQQTMKRFVYKISSSVLIDRCDNHGVWLNHGELKELIEWKQNLKNFRDREAEEEAYQKYGLKKQKSPYTYQRDYSTKTERFFEWLMGV
jgi:Zn-finger nucleic acid-binding protein